MFMRCNKVNYLTLIPFIADTQFKADIEKTIQGNPKTNNICKRTNTFSFNHLA